MLLKLIFLSFFFFLKVISNLSLLYKFLPEFLDDETPKDTTTVTKKRGKNTHIAQML